MFCCFTRIFLSNYVTSWVFRTVCKRRCITSRLSGIFQWFHLSLLTSGSLNQCQLLPQLWAWCTLSLSLSHISLSLRINSLKLQKITTKSKSINNHNELFENRTKYFTWRMYITLSTSTQYTHTYPLRLFIKDLFMTGLFIGILQKKKLPRVNL